MEEFVYSKLDKKEFNKIFKQLFYDSVIFGCCFYTSVDGKLTRVHPLSPELDNIISSYDKHNKL